jgi:hypothetical protein
MFYKSFFLIITFLLFEDILIFGSLCRRLPAEAKRSHRQYILIKSTAESFSEPKAEAVPLGKNLGATFSYPL